MVEGMKRFPEKERERQRTCVVNFCRTFISSFSLILHLTGSNLIQTLLDPP